MDSSMHVVRANWHACFRKNSASERTRTADPLEALFLAALQKAPAEKFNSQMLYLLSYRGIWFVPDALHAAPQAKC